uniref:Calcium homeostasis modulator family member 6 n=1 Tax=Oryzias sinensis TaxID=183150 RepID=A0A8C7Y3B5_9TELE
METIQPILKFASKQTNFGYGLLALITACGEQIFSSVAFKCPCNELNFIYGLVFLLVPALALLLLGIMLSNNTWKLTTGLCHRNPKLCKWRNLKSMGVTVIQISVYALVAPSTWIAVALLRGSYYECAMTGANSTRYRKNVCRGVNSEAECITKLQMFPCKSAGNESEEVLLTLRAHSQILGWLVIASILISSMLGFFVARCFSPISYLQLKFWNNYVEEEDQLMDDYSSAHAKKLAERNMKIFFKIQDPTETPTPPSPRCPPANIFTPSTEDWKKITFVNKSSPKDQIYSTLHRYVEKTREEKGSDKMPLLGTNDKPPGVDGGTVPT